MIKERFKALTLLKKYGIFDTENNEGTNSIKVTRAANDCCINVMQSQD